MKIRQNGSCPAGVMPVPGLVALSFVDCDHFAEAIRHQEVELLQTVPGRFSNQVLLMPLAHTLARYGVHQNPWLCSGTALPGHVSVILDTVSQGPTFQNGHPIYEERAFGLYGSGAEHFSRSSAGEYFYASFPEAQFQEAYQVVTRREAAVQPGEFRRVRPAERRWQALLQTITAIRIQAEDLPEAWHDPLMRAAMERSLLSALVLATVSSENQLEGERVWPSARARSTILRRALDYLKAHAGAPVYVLDLCRATAASERTLREAFLDQCGMGPMRYLKLRRLHAARRWLGQAAPGGLSIKAVALDNGFWDLGRFAVDYRSLFGESPSDTLMDRAESPRAATSAALPV